MDFRNSYIIGSILCISWLIAFGSVYVWAQQEIPHQNEQEEEIGESSSIAALQKEIQELKFQNIILDKRITVVEKELYACKTH